MSHAALTKFQEYLGDGVLETHSHRGDDTAIIDRARIREACAWLKSEPTLAFDMLTDLTAVDYLGREPRFEVVYHFYSVEHKHRLRIKVGVPANDTTVDTVCDMWEVANWMEREVWDLYGITFNDHPDPRRILMYEEFVGHPLRKDYPKEKRQPLSRRPPEEIAAALEGRDGKAGRAGTGPKNDLLSES